MEIILFWLPVIIAGLIAGSFIAAIGVYIVGMRIPFIGVCISHAALAGAVFGALFGLTGQNLEIAALVATLATATALGLIGKAELHSDANISVGIVFSLTMGLIFLGMGLLNITGRSDNDVRSMLWGSITFCTWRDVKIMIAVAIVTFGFIGIFYNELMAIMFSRHIAEANGIPVRLIWSGFLIITALALTTSFKSIGGLMVYSLIINPPTAAFYLTRSYGKAILTSSIIGAVSGLSGFAISALTDLPTGAIIVIVSSIIVAAAAIYHRINTKAVGTRQENR